MVKTVDIVVGSMLGDEGKGKVVSRLSSTGEYQAVARWNGGNNAGHTVYKNGIKYKTHMVPSGIFYNLSSIIGPNCIIHIPSFLQEVQQLNDWGFDTSLIKISPKAHVITEEHIQFDQQNLAKKLGTTGKGIAPCYAAKAARTGIRYGDAFPNSSYLWDEQLSGNLLCEGAQGVWLDINYGNYPYVTSSETLPYAACSLGFPPQKINKIYGIAKIYDTRSGEDPLFPSSLFDDPELFRLSELGGEFGVTTGRRRKVNWLNLDRLIKSINLTGTTDLIINKCDILNNLGVFKLFFEDKLMSFGSMDEMQRNIQGVIHANCPMCPIAYFSSDPEYL